MKKIFIYILASILLYSYFRELNGVKIFLIVLGLASIYGISLLPSRYVVAAKYPIILLSFAGTAGFLLYPALGTSYPVEPAIVFLAFYSITWYLVTMEEKGRDPVKEIVALSVLFLSVSFNLAMAGKPLLILPLGLAVILFLFILGKTRIMLFIAGYTLVITAVLVYKQIVIIGAGIPMREIRLYALLSTSFIFLAINFLRFVKGDGHANILAFFGFLYICIDLLVSTGLKLSGGLLNQPALALAMVSPLIGLMIQAEGGKA
ncbi:hypothetical protein [Syntrophorhabdus aromaticivorans]|mgnify:CR=1 FL=1|uniref:hypothetical protein n=1 Tax=Syntrophorhabdus aromaticivorans TaxID=328301 RepID=UPI0004136EE7|nr:hypothetical protein [Syntrophorhabdus aromaticivorans]HBA53744.1 hypothetical protein [Syntrophorhabdus aromaticivorans]